jgi:hypothetical protein
MQMLQPVHRSSSTVTTSLIMLIAMTGQRSMHPPHLVHFSESILTIPRPSVYGFISTSKAIAALLPVAMTDVFM